MRLVFNQRSATELAFLLRCELLESLRGITHELERYAAASYVLDLTDRMVLGQESGAEVYDLVREALGLLAAGVPLDPLLRAVELHLLRASGYAPAFDRCRRCGTPPDTALFLAVERGGLLCRRCVPPNERVVPVALETAALLTRLAAGRWRKPPAGTVSKRRAGSPRSCWRARRRARCARGPFWPGRALIPPPSLR